MKSVRELSYAESALVRSVQSLLQSTNPQVNKRGELVEISIPAGTLYVNSASKLTVAVKGRSLSPDSLAHIKQRTPDESELARWSVLIRVLTTLEPSVNRHGKLLEFTAGSRTIRLGPSGWVAVEEIPVNEAPELFEDATAQQYDVPFKVES